MMVQSAGMFDLMRSLRSPNRRFPQPFPHFLLKSLWRAEQRPEPGLSRFRLGDLAELVEITGKQE
jgi:hypothetical protein